jgi:penicillin-binding protein 2
LSTLKINIRRGVVQFRLMCSVQFSGFFREVQDKQNFETVSDNFRNRQLKIQVFFALAALVLVYKSLDLQLLDPAIKKKADGAAIENQVIYPARGTVYDRNGEILVYNKPIYDLMVTYNQIDWNMDTAKLRRLLGYQPGYFEDALDKNWKDHRFSKRVPFVFLGKISPETYARYQESAFEFPGFSAQLRSSRGYPHQNAAHLLGYIREVNPSEVNDSTGVYKLGDYIGASGLEQYYEEELRGSKGLRMVLKDNLGREVGPYADGNLDVEPQSGKDLFTTIDITLQAYGEKLMDQKVGSIVAIEPATGEVLAMISMPTYDPNVLTINQDRGQEYSKLAGDPLQPFFDRSVMAQYPPGSLFKSVVALIAMQEGLLKVNRTVSCAGGYFVGGAKTGCHGHPTCTSVSMAIQHSCNAYFVTVFREIADHKGFYNPQKGLDVFNKYLDQFGLGRTLGIDYPREKPGNTPSSKYYDDLFNRQQAGQKWNSLWIRSLGIGQGELLTTNLQLANLAAIIANRGHYYTPHLVKEIRDSIGASYLPMEFKQRHDVGVNREHFEPVIDGMEKAVLAGTARMAYIPDIPVCGKTGTAENNQGSGKDHSIFFAFAPKENPKIAIAVYVENGGWGGSFAAPIASLMIEKYLKGEISQQRKWLEQRMMTTNLIQLP